VTMTQPRTIADGSLEERARATLGITVVVPTYLRPGYLLGCLRALQQQTRSPDEVVVVMREDDYETRAAVEQFCAANHDLRLRSRSVTSPGFLPPVQAGIEASGGDIVVFTDDDAEPYPDWLERLESHYCDPRVGGVGGRVVNVFDGRERIYRPAATVGRYWWFGRAVGNMYRDLVPETTRRVDFLMGGNMSYRRNVLRGIQLDFNLNREVAFLYEVDVGLQVREMGYDLLYDPLARVKHFTAPRQQSGMRVRDSRSVYFHSHNLLYVALKHSRGLLRVASLGFSFLVGDRYGWGLLFILVESLRGNFRWRREIGAAMRGKVDAVREVYVRRGRPA
jgi:GT2 family glycosyltransferase